MQTDPAALVARCHRGFNDRDFAVCRGVLSEDVELVVDGLPLRGADAVVDHLVGLVDQVPELFVASERVVARSDEMIVSEIDLVNGDPASGGCRRYGRACEICWVRDGRIGSARLYRMADPGGEQNAVRTPTRRFEAAAVAAERTALRRMATLVARGVSQEQLFADVVREVGHLVAAQATSLLRYELDDTVRLVAAWSAHPVDLPIGSSGRVDDVLRSIRETWRSWRGPADVPLAGHWAEEARALGRGTSVGVPVVVDGRVWGAAVASSVTEASTDDVEACLAGFAELVATATSNAQAQVELRGVVEEQAALRRVATLVARATPPEELFAAVAQEVGRLLDVDFTVLGRRVPPGAQAVGAWSATGGDVPFPVGTQVMLGGHDVVSLVMRTGRAARIDDYADASGPTADTSRSYGLRSAVGVPIEVEDRLWGVMFAASQHQRPLPADTETRLAGFTELVATALADAQARIRLRGFADEQAALRRVATRVARAARAEDVFTVVAEEVARLLRVDYALLSRYDQDGLVTVVGGWVRAEWGRPFEGVGIRLKPEGQNLHALVFETRGPARIDDYADASGAFADVARGWGGRAAVGVPILVDQRLWGVMLAGSRAEPLPPGTENQLIGFTELVATAIANGEARAAVAASRARIVAAGDTARRHIERNLHDGAQQRLVSLALQLGGAVRASVPAGSETLTAQLDEVAAGLTDVLDELREIARGLHPATLAEGGLRPALRTLARRSAVPVRLDVAMAGRLPEPVELAAYYVVAEALTNATRHAGATVVDVRVELGRGLLRVTVRDDGRGGADATRGSGLVGLMDRVEALGGRLAVHSLVGAGTALEVALPVTVAEGMSSES